MTLELIDFKPLIILAYMEQPYPFVDFDYKRFRAVVEAFDVILNSSQNWLTFSSELRAILSLVKNQIFDFDDLVDKGVENGFLTEFDLWNLKDVVNNLFDSSYQIDFKLPDRTGVKLQRIRKNILTFFHSVFEPYIRERSTSKANIFLCQFIIKKLITQNMLANIEVGTNELKASKKESPFFSLLGTNQQTLYRTDDNLYPDRMGIKLGITTLILMRFPEFFSSFTEFLSFQKYLDLIDGDNSVRDDIIHVINKLVKGSGNFENVNYLHSQPNFDLGSSSPAEIIELCEIILHCRKASSDIALLELFKTSGLKCLERLSLEDRQAIHNIIRSTGIDMYHGITQSYLLNLQRRYRVNTKFGVANSA